MGASFDAFILTYLELLQHLGITASAKTSALIVTEETRKKLEEEAPGDKVHEIKPKLGKKALKKQKDLERNKTKGKYTILL